MRRLGFAIAVVIGALAAPVRAGTTDEPIDPDAAVEPRLPTVQLVQAWPKTKQALLYDPIQGTYVVVAAGQNVDGFRVTRIGKNQIVLSTLGGPARDYVLLPTPVADLPDAPAPTADAPKTPPPGPGPVADAPARPDLIDPYPSGTLDPYGSEGVRSVEAPPQSKATPGAPAPTTTAPATPSPVTTKSPAPVPPPAPAPTKPAAPAKPAVAKTPPASPAPATTQPAPAPASAASGAVALDKKALNDALADFSTLTKDSRLTLGPTGVAFAHVAPGSLFARIGLRDGDRIVSINGTPIRSIDDAADLYAQLGTMKQLTLDVVRGAGHVTLRADLR
jgi:hypothetical protein